jgi:hypothetical protein
MSTYNLSFSTCGYSSDPRLSNRAPRLYCDFELLASAKLKPLSGATREPIDYAALTLKIYNDLDKNIRFLSNPTSGIILNNHNSDKTKQCQQRFLGGISNDTNYASSHIVTNDVSKQDDKENNDEISGSSNENDNKNINVMNRNEDEDHDDDDNKNINNMNENEEENEDDNDDNDDSDDNVNIDDIYGINNMEHSFEEPNKTEGVVDNYLTAKHKSITASRESGYNTN